MCTHEIVNKFQWKAGEQNIWVMCTSWLLYCLEIPVAVSEKDGHRRTVPVHHLSDCSSPLYRHGCILSCQMWHSRHPMLARSKNWRSLASQVTMGSGVFCCRTHTITQRHGRVRFRQTQTPALVVRTSGLNYRKIKYRRKNTDQNDKLNQLKL